MFQNLLTMSAIFAVLIVTSCVSMRKADCLDMSSLNSPACAAKPVQVLKMNPKLDARKPLAPFDKSGWIILDSSLIGAVDNEWLISQNLKNSNVNWWFKLSASLTAPPLSVGEHLIIATRDGLVKMIRSDNGEKVWELQAGHFVDRPLQAVGDSLFFSTVSQQVFSVSLKDGARQWIYDAGRPSALMVQTGAGLLVSGDNVYFGSSDGVIHCLERPSGRLSWSYALKGANSSRFNDIVGTLGLVESSLLVSSYNGEIASIDLKGVAGATIWQRSFSAITTSFLQSGVWYLGHLNGDVQAIDPRNGKQIWQASLGSAISGFFVSESLVYVTSSSGFVAALNISDGAYSWHDSVDGLISSQPLSFENVLYVPTGLKVLYGYQM